jgi:serine/threonine-protein kinase
MNMPDDHDRTVDVPSTPADSLDAGLAAGFGPPCSSLGDLRPVLLKEAAGGSAHLVQTTSDAIPSPEQTGNRYQLQGEIARGGMGAVLRGRDVDLGRDLAVKVLLEKHVHRPEVARRFIEEAQIGGQLQHPGVVPVYDIGRFGERPFFTMKLVKGQTFAALLAERNVGQVANLPGENQPSSKLAPHDLPRFLAIALQVAQTLAYAHAKGVIHRDLKPANVMVGAFGEVQVMDWGLAKVLAEGGTADEEKASRERERPEDVTTIRTARSTGSGIGTDTEAGSLLGTPAYMPPEQANGEVANLDRRADVFGLGAILCEILTGKPPYVGRSSEEVRRKACNGDLADAKARLDASGADQELVVLTKACISPEAIDRPRDAQAVADGLTAYLDGVQERLHQAELAEAEARARAIEEAKRRRLTLALAGTVLLALTLGGGGWLWVKGEHDARQAQVARDVNDAMNKAAALREHAKTAGASSAAQFAQAREQAQRAWALVESGPADDTLKTLVRQVLRELDEEENDRKLVAALDEARLAQAETLAGENRFAVERAVPKFRQAFAAYGLPAGQGEPAAVAERIQQRPAAVQEAIVAALDEWDDLAGNPTYGLKEPHRQWLRAVRAAADPHDAWGRQVRVARRENDPAKRSAALEALVKSANVAKLPAGALTRLARQFPPSKRTHLLRRAHAQYPADFWINHDLGTALQEVTPPEDVEAVRFLTAAVALRPQSPGAHFNLGLALHRNGQLDEGIASWRKATALDSKYTIAHNNLAVVLTDKGQLDAAIACLQRAIALDPKLALAQNNLGEALRRKGQLDEAIAHCREAIALDPKLAAAHCNLGNALDGKGQVDEAIACFREAIALDPKYATAHNNLGEALTRKGQLDEAITHCRKAIALDPKSALAHINLGHALKVKGQVDEAIAWYQKAIALNPKFALAHINLGAALCDIKRDYDAAIACFRRAIELDPNHPKAHLNLGLALYRKGQLDEAMVSFKKVIALDPKDAGAHFSLGGALGDKGRVDEAIPCYRKAIEFDPKLAMAHAKLGNALQAKGQVDEAIACFRQAIALDPKDAGAHSNLGNALDAKGQLNAAIASWRRAIELDPKRAVAHCNLGGGLGRRGKIDLAITSLRKAIALDPKLAMAHNNMGRALEIKGQLDAAIASWRTAIELDPKLTRAHFNLAMALTNKGQLDEAIAFYKKAIALDPKHAAAHANLAMALGRKDQVDEAIACWRKAIALDPKSASAHYHLGLALHVRGQVEEAIACYKKAIALDPKHAAAHYHLGSALADKGQVDEAIEFYKKAITLDPMLAAAHNNLGFALLGKGQADEAIACFKKAVALDPKDPLARVNLARAKRMAPVRDKFPAFQKGSYTPAKNDERIGLAEWCWIKKRHHAATRLYTAAFAADAKLADDLEAGHRYSAACHAALAAAGQGEDAAKLDDQEKARLRKQALAWLRADLALYARQVKSGQPADRAEVKRQMKDWQNDSDFAGLQGAAALARLPAEERAAWAKLWVDVAALLKKAEMPAKETKP